MDLKPKQDKELSFQSGIRLKTKLMIYSTFLVTIPLVIVGYLSYQFARDGLATVIEERLNGVAESKIVQISDMLSILPDETPEEVVTELISELVSEIKVGEKGFGYLVNQKGNILLGPEEYKKSSSSEHQFIQYFKATKNGFYEYDFNDQNLFASYRLYEKRNWILVVTADSEEVTAAIKRIYWLVLTSIIGFVIAATVGGAFFIRIITKPLEATVEIVKKVSQGDLGIDIQIESSDEMGLLQAEIKKMLVQLKDKVELADQIAMGNLLVEVILASDKDTLGQALQKMLVVLREKDQNAEELIFRLREVLNQVAFSADQLSKGAQQTSESGQKLARGTMDQSAALEEISSSMEEMSQQTSSNAENATQASQLADSTRQQAEAGDTQMQLMLNSMEEINLSSENIYEIIKTIEEIAFQTNVLAINAAVEAAQVGIHGKGFAVVAEEVRNLATRSAGAAQEISHMIKDSVKKVEVGSKIADDTANSLKKIVVGSIKVTDFIEQIAKSSAEQARGVREINNGLAQLNQVVQKNSSISEESAAAGSELNNQSQNLGQLVARFKFKQEDSKSTHAQASLPDMRTFE